GSHERMTKDNPRVELEQTFVLDGDRRGVAHAEDLGGPPDQRGVAGWFGRCHEQEAARLEWQPDESSPKARLDATGEGTGDRQRKPTGELGRRQAPRQFE